jgi:hypothetical protein
LSSDIAASIGVWLFYRHPPLVQPYPLLLPLVLRDHPNLAGIDRLTLLQSLGCVRLVLWDEDRQRLVSFREARQHI